MKAKQLLIPVFIALCSIGITQAADDPWYAGVKAGQFRVDESEYDKANGAGGILGYKFSNSLAVEGGYSTTGTDGGLKVSGVEGTWNVEAYAVHFAYRSEGTFYFKGKAGYLHENVGVDIAGASVSGSDSGASYGIGLGWRPVKDISFELEYTAIEKDVNFITVGINFGL